MRKSRFTEAKIAAALHEGEAWLPVAELLRNTGYFEAGLSSTLRTGRSPDALLLSGVRRLLTACAQIHREPRSFLANTSDPPGLPPFRAKNCDVAHGVGRLGLVQNNLFDGDPSSLSCMFR